MPGGGFVTYFFAKRSDRWGGLAFILALSLLASFSQADTKLTIIHTSDLHSHFTSRESQNDLGGLARLKTKIDEVRSRNPNSLLLDAGDWSEGTIFFTLDSGAQTQSLLQKFNYDAMVLGNHDWLVGPNELYDAFVKSGMKTPVVGANLNFQDLSPQVPLKEVIKPYIIKWVGGKKVGIVGLSTFQVVYDHFFDPVKIIDPVSTAQYYARYLKTIERCDVVIALSHLGIGQDKIIATMAPGIDAIIGGHTHILLPTPAYMNQVPIFHIGKWGEFLGEYELNISDRGYVSVSRHTIHQIDSSVTPNAEIAAMVDDSHNRIEQQFGAPVFSDKLLYTDVDLQISDDIFTNDWMGQLAVDSLREAGQTDVAFDSPKFSGIALYRGWNHTADLFNILPHIYKSSEKKGWTVLTYNVRGYVIRALMSLFVKFKLPLKVSNIEMVIDHGKLDPVVSIKINGEPLSLVRNYSVSSTRGILDFFLQLRNFGVKIGPTTWEDTGLEAWRVTANKLKAYSPISREKLTWEGSVRSLQPDLAVTREYVWLE